MNRKQRRKIENELMRKHKISREAAKRSVAAWETMKTVKEEHNDPELRQQVQDFADGTAVKINVDQILSEPTEKNENYLAFLQANRDRIFHVSRDDPKASETIVTLEEDTTKPHWLWSTINLIPVEEDMA